MDAPGAGVAARNMSTALRRNARDELSASPAIRILPVARWALPTCTCFRTFIEFLSSRQGTSRGSTSHIVCISPEPHRKAIPHRGPGRLYLEIERTRIVFDFYTTKR